MPPPKKNLAAEELEDIKRSLDFLTEESSDVKLQQKTILELVEEVKALRIQNAEKDRRLDYLENRVADLEQYSRMNYIIVTGLHIKPWSYAKAVTADNGGSPVSWKLTPWNNRWLPSSNPRGLRWTATTLRHATLCPGEMTTKQPS
ncbi:hypothetical protein AAFF_G00112360 [Aldrovandia affinis]|uniref:Uncharacterized protein n=1 Tax=Aldrovandia affinis TaxID=143900 RepID=A0AAD7WAI0_9TELE|nr:hypothetical protein AAFF_G00112360 [Aldrovandia affinis]